LPPIKIPKSPVNELLLIIGDEYGSKKIQIAFLPILAGGTYDQTVTGSVPTGLHNHSSDTIDLVKTAL
jgi:hypothetical protein